MRASMLLSPGIWDLLERLRPHLDVVVDFFDPHFSALLPERDDDVAVAVRRLVASSVDTPVGSRLQAALRTGQHQVLTAEGLVAAVFPLRHQREVVAVLVVARPVSDDLETGVLIDYGVERLGWSLRGTIEADIVTHEKLGDEERRSRWLSTILHFLEHLHHCASQHDLFVTLVEGVAIWGDVDARVYRRGLDGVYSLDAALPSVLADAAAPHRFPAAVLGGHPPVTRVSSIAELEQLGWPAATGELLIIRVPARKSAEFLLAVSGAVNAEFERVLTIGCQTLATCLETLAAERARSLQDRMLRTLAGSTLRFPAPATALLGELATAVHAVHARLLLREGTGESPRTLAAIGGSPLRLLPSNLPETSSLERPDRIVLPIAPGSGSMAWLDLGASPARKFTPGDAEAAEEAARTFSAWLTGALQSPAHHGSTVAASRESLPSSEALRAGGVTSGLPG